MPKNAGAQKNVDGDSSPSSNVVYTNLAYDELNDLDRMARFIIAVAHSVNYSPRHREQGFIGQRTVAVALNKGTLYVAQNNVLTSMGRTGSGKPTFVSMDLDLSTKIRQHVKDKLAEEYTDPDSPEDKPLSLQPFQKVVWISAGGWERTDFHAEMQLVNFFKNQNLAFEKNQIGVSKPCCSNCASRLTALGIDYSYFHTQTALPWKDPGVKKRWF